MKNVFAAAVTGTVLALFVSTPSGAWTMTDHERMAGILQQKLSCLSGVVVQHSSWADRANSKDGGVTYLDEEITNCLWVKQGYGDLSHAYYNVSSIGIGCAPDNAKGFFAHSADAVSKDEATRALNAYLFDNSLSKAEAVDVVSAYLFGGASPLRLLRGVHFIEDLGVIFHTEFGGLVYGLSCQQKGHAAYESWVTQNWASLNLSKMFGDGVSYQVSYNGPSKSLSKDQLAKDLAAITDGNKDKIMGSDSGCAAGYQQWKNNPAATQLLMYSVGKYAAAYVRGSSLCN